MRTENEIKERIEDYEYAIKNKFKPLLASNNEIERQAAEQTIKEVNRLINELKWVLPDKALCLADLKHADGTINFEKGSFYEIEENSDTHIVLINKQGWRHTVTRGEWMDKFEVNNHK